MAFALVGAGRLNAQTGEAAAGRLDAQTGQAVRERSAPEPVVESAGGTITGRVVADDTQRGARFVQVTAWPAPQPGGSSAPETAAQPNGGGRNRTVRFARPMGGSTITGLDGEFTLGPLAPGDYYMQARAAGYVSIGAQVRQQLADGASADDILARLPIAHVVGDGSSNVVITLERGGTLGGTVQWEDGSPAAGLSIAASPSKPLPTLPEGLRAFPLLDGALAVMTDDRGHFRLSGLAPGEYLLRAATSMRSVMVPGRGFHLLSGTINVWSPGVMHKADAQPLTVHQGEERDDVRLVLDLGRLHTISGRVTGMQPGQALTGDVMLRDPKDGEFNRQGSVDADGGFSVAFVPEGTYVLHVNVRAQEQAPPLRPAAGGRGYRGTASAPVQEQSGEQTVTVGSTDVAGVVIGVGTQ